MHNIKVSDLLVGKINENVKLLILTGKLLPDENNSFKAVAVDMENNEYILKMHTIFESWFLPYGPFTEYKFKNNIFIEVYSVEKLRELLKKEKFEEVNVTEIKALEILVKKLNILKYSDIEQSDNTL